MHLIEFAGDLLAVAGDERDRTALGEELGGGGNLGDLDIQLRGDAEDMVGIE